MSKKITVVTPMLTESQLMRIRASAEAHGYTLASPIDKRELLSELTDTEIAFGTVGDYLKEAPELKWFCSFFAGVENCLSPELFASPDVILSNSSGAYGVMISEHIIMCALELMRRRAEYFKIVERREWVRDLHVRSLKKCRAVLLGTGDLGSETAKRLRAFEPESITGVNRSGVDKSGLFDRIVPVTELESVLPEAELLIMSLPETGETKGVMSRDRLQMLPEGAMIINVGRGSAIDQSALEELLRTGKLGGAALDVFEKEPIPQESTLWSCPGLLITPHIAGTFALDYAADRVVDLFLEDFDNYCCGRPLERRVLREIGY